MRLTAVCLTVTHVSPACVQPRIGSRVQTVCTRPEHTGINHPNVTKVMSLIGHYIEESEGLNSAMEVWQENKRNAVRLGCTAFGQPGRLTHRF